jgi:hypothetical protein
MLLPVMHMHFVCAWAMAPSLIHGEKSRFTDCGRADSAELPPKAAIDASTTTAANNALMVAPAITSSSSLASAGGLSSGHDKYVRLVSSAHHGCVV